MQRARPEVSAATAAVVDRAVAKDLDAPLPRRRQHGRRPRGGARDRGRARRAGHRRGHDACCARCPARRAGACPGACATPRAGSPRSALVGAIVAIVLVARRAARAPRHRRRPRRRSPAPASGRSRSARPPPTTTTRSAPAPKTATRSATSSTATPTPTGAPQHYYERHAARRPAAPASGVYLDAAPGVAARAIEMQTPTPGFDVAGLRRATASTCPIPTATRRRSTARGWHGPLGSRQRRARRRQRIALARRRHALPLLPVWLTTLPPGQQSATIAELTLFR